MRVPPPLYTRRATDHHDLSGIDFSSPEVTQINWEGIFATLGISALGWIGVGILIQLLR
jgi:hypothetical protein